MKYPEVEHTTDPSMSMDEAWSFLTHLQRKHGVKSTVRFSENKIIVQPTKMATVRCPKCKALAGVRADGTLSNHNYKTAPFQWTRCADSGKEYKKP